MLGNDWVVGMVVLGLIPPLSHAEYEVLKAAILFSTGMPSASTRRLLHAEERLTDCKCEDVEQSI